MTEWPGLGAPLVFAPLCAVGHRQPSPTPPPLLNVSLRQATESGVKVVHAYCPAAEHLRLLPESFYQCVIRSDVHINGEQPDELADRRELRPCNLHVQLKRGALRVSGRPAVWVVSQPGWGAAISWSRAARRRRANGHELRRPEWTCCSWLLYDVLAPIAAKDSVANRRERHLVPPRL
jgi:hypothetical protein